MVGGFRTLRDTGFGVWPFWTNEECQPRDTSPIVNISYPSNQFLIPVFLHRCNALFQKSPLIRAEKPFLTGQRPKREVQDWGDGIEGGRASIHVTVKPTQPCVNIDVPCGRGLGKRGSSEPVSTSNSYDRPNERTTFEFSAAKQIATNLLVSTNSKSGVPNITLLFEVSRCAFPSSRPSHRARRRALRI